MSISLHPWDVRICVGIDPQNGDHFGGEMAVRSRGPGFDAVLVISAHLGVEMAPGIHRQMVRLIARLIQYISPLGYPNDHCTRARVQ